MLSNLNSYTLLPRQICRKRILHQFYQLWIPHNIPIQIQSSMLTSNLLKNNAYISLSFVNLWAETSVSLHAVYCWKRRFLRAQQLFRCHGILALHLHPWYPEMLTYMEEAIKDEPNSLMINNIWPITQLPPYRTPIKSWWVSELSTVTAQRTDRRADSLLIVSPFSPHCPLLSAFKYPMPPCSMSAIKFMYSLCHTHRVLYAIVLFIMAQ